MEKEASQPRNKLILPKFPWYTCEIHQVQTDFPVAIGRTGFLQNGHNSFSFFFLTLASQFNFSCRHREIKYLHDVEILEAFNGKTKKSNTIY